MNEPWTALEHARRLLLEAGLVFGAEPLRWEPRGELCVTRLPDERIVWFSTSESATRQLVIERRLLNIVAKGSKFKVPSVDYVSDDGRLDVRTTVPGIDDFQIVFERASRERDFANRLGTQVGMLLADLHQCALTSDVAQWLRRSLEWPLARPCVVQRLEKVVDDRRLIARADGVLKVYENLRISPADCTLLHGDVGFHNLVFDPNTLELRGVFDFKDAAFADRHLDFRYLVFDLGHFELFEAACRAYSTRTGSGISRERVLLYNAVWAISFLAYRAGTRPDELSLGRTLDVDLRWTRAAVTQVLDLGIMR